jgi:hypothetical protein
MKVAGLLFFSLALSHAQSTVTIAGSAALPMHFLLAQELH